MEFKKAAGPESPKKKKARLRRKPVGKKETAAPEKKKLVAVHFKEPVSHKSPYNCRWALGKVFEIITGSKTMQRPEPLKLLKLQNSDKPKD